MGEYGGVEGILFRGREGGGREFWLLGGVFGFFLFEDVGLF